MVKKELVNYVKKYNKEGYSPHEIREALLVQNVEKNDIDSAFKAASIEEKAPEEKKSLIKDETKSEKTDEKTKEEVQVLADLPNANQYIGSLIFTFFFLLSAVSFRFTGFKFEYLLMPMKFTNSIMSGEIMFDYLFLIISVVAFIVAFTILTYYVMRYRDVGKMTWIVPIMAAVLVGVLGDMKIAGIATAICFFAATLIYIVQMRRKKEIYKVISWYEVPTKAFAHSFIIISIILSLLVMTTLMMDISYVDQDVEAFFQYAGYDKTIDEMKVEMKQAEKDMTYTYLDSVESSLLTSITTETNHTAMDRLRCFDMVNSSLERIDIEAKKNIDQQLESTEYDEAIEEKFETIKKLKAGLSGAYAYMIALTLFFIFEFSKKVIELIIGLLASIIVLFLPKPTRLVEEDKVEKKEKKKEEKKEKKEKKKK